MLGRNLFTIILLFCIPNIIHAEIIIPQPKWTDYPPVRQVSSQGLGRVLADIESHMPAGHIYRDADKITWGHETSHGIASNIRGGANSGRLSLFPKLRKRVLIPNETDYKLTIPVQRGGRKNGFYCLQNQAVIINEPNTHIRNVAQLVPRSLRGGVYQLYMISQAGSWGDTPLYICDEWVGYTNGSEVRLDLKIQSRQETLQYALEFCVYSSCIPWASKSNDPQLKAFLMWNTYRCMWLWEESKKQIGPSQRQDTYLETMRTSPDAETWRQMVRDYYGKEWIREVLGF